MFVYSKRIFQFIQEIRKTVQAILVKEIGLKASSTRFYDKQQQYSYPIKVVIFNNKALLGYFEADFLELGFNECLMHANKKQLHDIIRHEVAHYLTFIEHGKNILPHGQEFRAFCLSQGWKEEIYKATCCIETENKVFELEESGVLRKVQKLMALTKSANPHEAELAMIKSQELLLKHHIDAKYLSTEEEEKVVLKRIMKQGKETAKMRSIAKIVETFFVSIVYNRGGGFIYLEVLGDPVNVEIAEYVAGFLDREFESMWRHAQKFAGLSGAVAKNSFFMGIAKGYCDKIQSLKSNYDQQTASALMVIEKQLIEMRSEVYSRLTKTRSSNRHCRESSAHGEQMGKNLTINPGVSSKSLSLIGLK